MHTYIHIYINTYSIYIHTHKTRLLYQSITLLGQGVCDEVIFITKEERSPEVYACHYSVRSYILISIHCISNWSIHTYIYIYIYIYKYIQYIHTYIHTHTTQLLYQSITLLGQGVCDEVIFITKEERSPEVYACHYSVRSYILILLYCPSKWSIHTYMYTYTHTYNTNIISEYAYIHTYTTQILYQSISFLGHVVYHVVRSRCVWRGHLYYKRGEVVINPLCI